MSYPGAVRPLRERVELHPSVVGRLAAFGTRRLVRFAQWRGRRQAQASAGRPTDQVFRSFIQINLIRPG